MINFTSIALPDAPEVTIMDFINPVVEWLNGFISTTFLGYEIFIVLAASFGLGWFTKSRMHGGLLSWVLYGLVWFGALRYLGIGG